MYSSFSCDKRCTLKKHYLDVQYTDVLFVKVRREREREREREGGREREREGGERERKNLLAKEEACLPAY